MNLADATVSLLMLFECQTVGMDRSRRTEVARQWIARLAGAGDDCSHFRSGVPWSKPCAWTSAKKLHQNTPRMTMAFMDKNLLSMQSTQHHIIVNGKQTDSRIHKKQVNLRSKAQRIKSITQFQDF